MTNDITGFGTIVNIVASSTFPATLPITQFADDSDPLDISAVQIADTAMGLNGDLIKWAKAVPLPMVLNVIPGSLDDQNLQILADANRVAQGKTSSRDLITATIIYSDGSTTTLTQGTITNAQFGNSIASQGRLKTKTYTFMFQNKVGS